MTVPVLSAARRLAEKSGWTLSNLQLQKILYLAHMFYMGRTNGAPLVPGHFEAWEYGPVHPDLYHKAKVFGSDPVENIFHGNAPIKDGPEQEILDEALKSLGGVAPSRLVAATHRKNGAWYNNYNPGTRHCVIPNQDIWDEYRNLDSAA